MFKEKLILVYGVLSSLGLQCPSQASSDTRQTEFIFSGKIVNTGCAIQDVSRDFTVDIGSVDPQMKRPKRIALEKNLHFSDTCSPNKLKVVVDGLDEKGKLRIKAGGASGSIQSGDILTSWYIAITTLLDTTPGASGKPLRNGEIVLQAYPGRHGSYLSLYSVTIAKERGQKKGEVALLTPYHGSFYGHVQLKITAL